MTQRAVGVTDVASGAGVADYRVRERSVGGATVDEQYLIYVAEKVPSFVGLASTFRTNNLVPIMTIENQVGSGVLVAVRDVIVSDHSLGAILTSMHAYMGKTSAMPSGGTTLTKVAQDTALSSSANVVVRGTVASDGGADTALTATVAARLHSWVTHRQNTTTTTGGQSDNPRVRNTLRRYRGTRHGRFLSRHKDRPIILREGEALYVRASATSSTRHYVGTLVWEEYTLP